MGGDKSQISQANDSAGETDLGIISEVTGWMGKVFCLEIFYAWWTKLSYTFNKTPVQGCTFDVFEGILYY
jgi:hypothetical protein